MQIGIDIEEIKRFENKLEDKTFLNRVFSEKELEYCFSKNFPAQHLCARFCAKEALIKALSDKSLSLNKIEILNDETGKPYIKMNEKYLDKEIIVSLSHCKNYACANVLIK
jgi:holo-[acyl-carrier protein] synthase